MDSNRAVMSTRSRLRPSTRKPPTLVTTHGRFGETGQHGCPFPDKAEEQAGPSRSAELRRDAGRECQVTLRHSHISLEMVSERRGRSPGPTDNAPAIELGLSTSNPHEFEDVTGGEPAIGRRGRAENRQATTGRRHPRRSTDPPAPGPGTRSRIRAVSSARST